VRPDRTPPFIRVLGQVGAAVNETLRTLLGLTGFFGATLIALWGVIPTPVASA
jgi:phospholipid/cholesterol/gamma-HCH transport system permease protein